MDRKTEIEEICERIVEAKITRREFIKLSAFL